MDNFMFQKFMKAKKEDLKDDEVLEEDNDSLDEVLEDESVEDNDDKKREEEKGYVAKKKINLFWREYGF